VRLSSIGSTRSTRLSAETSFVPVPALPSTSPPAPPSLFAHLVTSFIHAAYSRWGLFFLMMTLAARPTLHLQTSFSTAPLP
jgi:hypothetical protein